MLVAPKGSRFKYEERPAPCRVCGSVAWWNGWRAIKGEVGHDGASDAVVRREGRRHRARCSRRDGKCRSWTVYGEDAYPHRVFQLSAVSSAVTTVALEKVTMTESARRHDSSRRSVSRWVKWVASFLDVAGLVRLCARLGSQQGLPPPALAASEAQAAHRAGVVLVLLDHLCGLLREGGVALSRDGPALGVLLGDQLARFGEVVLLTRPSPPLRVDVGLEAG